MIGQSEKKEKIITCGCIGICGVGRTGPRTVGNADTVPVPVIPAPPISPKGDLLTSSFYKFYTHRASQKKTF